jgi:hypothetical protein
MTNPVRKMNKFVMAITYKPKEKGVKEGLGVMNHHNPICKRRSPKR